MPLNDSGSIDIHAVAHAAGSRRRPTPTCSTARRNTLMLRRKRERDHPQRRDSVHATATATATASGLRVGARHFGDRAICVGPGRRRPRVLLGHWRLHGFGERERQRRNQRRRLSPTSTRRRPDMPMARRRSRTINNTDAMTSRLTPRRSRPPATLATATRRSDDGLGTDAAIHQCATGTAAALASIVNGGSINIAAARECNGRDQRDRARGSHRRRAARQRRHERFANSGTFAVSATANAAATTSPMPRLRIGVVHNRRRRRGAVHRQGGEFDVHAGAHATASTVRAWPGRRLPSVEHGSGNGTVRRPTRA